MQQSNVCLTHTIKIDAQYWLATAHSYTASQAGGGLPVTLAQADTGMSSMGSFPVALILVLYEKTKGPRRRSHPACVAIGGRGLDIRRAPERPSCSDASRNHQVLPL
eukprot:365798-Chlamydomonas_euryale.AAC.6